MDKNTLIQDAREILKGLLSFEKQEVKFTDYTDANGLKIASPDDKLDIGSEVNGVDEQGNLIPLDNGEYNLTDGSTIVVMDGKVSEIKAFLEPKDGDQTPVEDASVEAAADPVAPAADMAPAEAESPDDAKAESDVADRVAKLEEVVATILQALDKLTSGSQQMAEKVETFAKQPGAESIKKTIVDRELSTEEKRTERMRAISQSVR
jgi:hypothetical protein